MCLDFLRKNKNNSTEYIRCDNNTSPNYNNALKYMKNNKVKNFSISEFPKGSLEWLSSDFMQKFFKFRDQKASWYMTPSPLKRAHVRHDFSSSLHSTMRESRMSMATDMFLNNTQQWWDVLCSAIYTFGGVGIYLSNWMFINGKKYYLPMFHFDDRDVNLFWVYKNGNYYYNINSSSAKFICKLLEGATHTWDLE